MKPIALILSVIGVLLLHAASPLEEIPGTNLVYTATETDALISTNNEAFVDAVTNCPGYARGSAMPSGGGITTNDVCNIVTNTVGTGWKFPDVFNGFLYAPSDEWMRTEGDTASSYYIPSNIRRESGKWMMYVGFWDYDDGWIPNDGYDFESSESANAKTVHFDDPYNTEDLVVTRIYYNALGLARLSDLPQKTPVDELLLNGADGKVYHLRIGSGGSIDIYMEVTP